MPGEQRRHLIRQHAQTIASLPDSEEHFEFKEVDIDQSQLRLFKENSIIEREKDAEDTAARGDIRVWSVKDDAKREAEAYLERISTFPCCGSTGVTNRGGNLYCDECGAPISRDLFQEVLG